MGANENKRIYHINLIVYFIVIAIFFREFGFLAIILHIDKTT
jgi:hypothetical protein